MTDVVDGLSNALASRYRLERELGAGGMATVYLAHDLKHERQVAIKVLRPELAAVLGADRFVQEIKTTAKLQHPHILPLFDSGQADGFLYYVMPYIEGETLRDKLNREKQLGIEEAVRITTEVADALDYAHRHDVIHRDIKPENILLHDGRPLVADFGIALAVSAAAGGRMTETGLSLGTPHYMSPEQATAEKDISHRSDIYSLGAVLYEMLTGDPPHTGSTALQIIAKIVTEEIPSVTKLRKAVPPNVAAAVGKALEKLPADRFSGAKGFVRALQNPAFTVASSRLTSVQLRTPVAYVVGIALVGAVAGWVASGILRSGGEPAATATRHRQVTFDGTAEFPALSPDGEWLAYQITRCPSGGVCWSEVMVQDLSGGEPIGIGPTIRDGIQEMAPRFFWDIEWSLDGRQVLVAAGYPDNRFTGLYVIPRLGGAPRLVGLGDDAGSETTDIATRLVRGSHCRQTVTWRFTCSFISPHS